MFGTGVNCLPNHNPVMLAHRVAQLDQMARGRFYWGIGSGGFVGDLALFEVDAQVRPESDGLPATCSTTCSSCGATRSRAIYEHPRWRFRVPEPNPDDQHAHVHEARTSCRIRRSAWPA